MRKFPTALLAAVLVILAVCAGMGEEAVFQPKDLPVIYVHIDGGQAETEKMNSSPDHSYRCTGTMDVVLPEGYTGGYEGRFLILEWESVLFSSETRNCFRMRTEYIRFLQPMLVLPSYLRFLITP